MSDSAKTKRARRLSLLDQGVPLIAAPFNDGVPEERLRYAKAHGLDVAELRIDLFDEQNAARVVSEAHRYSAFTRLLTVRMEKEGGGWKHSEAARLELFKAVIPHIEMADIELRSSIVGEVVEAGKLAGAVVVISFHDFEHTPTLAELHKVMNESEALGADVVKIATQVNNEDDLRTLASLLLTNPDKRLVVIAMGEVGLLSRIFFPALGSRLTFAYVEQASAPGQLSLEETANYMRTFYPAICRR